MLTISYNRLWALLRRRGQQPADLSRSCALSASTVRQLVKGQEVSLQTLRRICEGLHVNLGDICEFVPVKKG